ncbi:MAG: transglycosylase SLT domain-containing protein [Candidatus Hydrogenedentes bacterium]|nr:transglycosylase SLT domain-containing protein [Candidatus Hydrogenedentota bacterium]
MISSFLLGSLCMLASLPGEVSYLQGYEAYRAADYGKALKAFQASEGDPSLGPWATVRIGMCLARQKNGAGAEAAYRKVIDGPEGPWRSMARGHMAKLSAERQDHAGVIAQLSGFEQIAPTPWWMESYLWQFSEAALTRPEVSDPRLDFLRDTIENTNYIKQRLDASRLLIKSPTPQDQTLALLGLLRASAYTDLKEKLPLAPVSLPGAGGAMPVSVLAAQLYDPDPGNDSSVLALLREQSADPAAHFVAAYATRIATQKKNYVGAEFLCSFLVDIAPETRDAGETVWYLGGVLEKEGRLADAARVYELLPSKCKNHFRADDALYQLGQLYLNQGNAARGLEYFVRLGREYPDSRFRSQAYYKCATHPATASDSALTRLYYTAASDNGLGYYYAHRALERLKEAKVPTGAPDVNLRVDGTNPVLLPFGNLLEELPPLPESVIADPAYQRLSFFARHGLEESEWEVVPMLQGLNQRPDREIRLRAIAEAGLAHTALQFATHEGWGVDEQGRRSLARLRLEYPRAYWEEVQDMARETGLDPYFILSIARQESTFRPNLTSRSGASGVMQIMPATAKWMADVDPNIEPVHVANLESPVNSLRLGAWYLHRMVERSNGNLIDAAASYNGGPGNRDKWRAKFRNLDLDAFVEAIPVDETRDYVQKVLGNYAAYRSLYPPAS